jgi:hypothetical protein
MSYETQTKADEYIDIMCGVSSGFDEETLHNEFAWLVQAVLSDPTHAREMLIDAIKSHTK